MCVQTLSRPGAGLNVVSDFESARFVSIRICEWHLFSWACEIF
jgi:hypothetical protein